tara:strand:+ start:721 stop:1038 length:318 start_codon:yes stop_codon:yes gene_type:complete
MFKWTPETKEEVILLIKEWLKQHNKTQKDLRLSLNANSERMHSLLEVLQKDYSKGGLPQLATKLCEIENAWLNKVESTSSFKENNSDPFGQLDLLLEEINEDCTS